jgi:signal transduction histidine kinase
VTGSLRVRLLLGALIWIVLALVVAGAVIALMFTANVDQTVRTGLSASLSRVVALIDPAQAEPGLREPLADPRYDIPQSGAYWQVVDVDSGTMARSRSLWDHVLPLPPGTGPGETYFTADGPAGQRLSALTRRVRFQTEAGMRTYDVTLAENRRILDESIARFGADLVAALAVLGLVLIAAAYLQVRLGLEPLRTIRLGVEAVRRGEAQRLPADQPGEVAPLVNEVNELLATQERAIEHARARAADLAHGLKTPLAALSGIAAELRRSEADGPAASIEEVTDEMSERIDYQLRLARLRMRNRTHRMHAPLAEICLRTLGVLRHSEPGENLDWEIEIDEALRVDIEHRDLAELLGVLLENAAKWANGRIEVTAAQEQADISLTIADDGPGLSETEIAAIGQRGQRLDESRSGTGLGLAIAREIVSLNGGTMQLGRSALGGLEVRLQLRAAGVT